MQAQPGESSKELLSQSKLKRWSLAALLLGAMLMAYWFGLYEYLSLGNFLSQREALAAVVQEHFAVALMVYALTYTVAVALSVPGASFMTVAGGFLFGWWAGGLVTVFSATLGASLVFLAARSFLADLVRKWSGPALQKIAAGFRKDAFSYLLFLRLTPIFPFWLVNVGPALFGTRFDIYVWSTLIGIVPGTFAFTFLGAGLDAAIVNYQASHPECAIENECQFDISALVTGQLLIALVALGLVALVPVIARRLSKSSGGPEGSGDVS